jgi:uncharacterized protein YfdQ (DUF2303 family)
LSEESTVSAILRVGGALGEAKHSPAADGTPYVVLPDGFQMVDAPVEVRPKRPIAKVRLRDATSFINYFNSHKVASSRIYALLQPASFIAVLDDFAAAERQDAYTHNQADWRQFRAQFDVPPSLEWATWNKLHKHSMTQVQFAEFLLDNLPDVRKPDGSTLYDMALRFEAAQTGSFKSAVRLQDGSHSLNWVAETAQGGSGDIKLPEFITLAIPVFENSERTEMEARLRYRVKEGSLSIWYELVRPHKVLEAEFRKVFGLIVDQCETTILLGTPE